jgi:hypothetical protein
MSNQVRLPGYDATDLDRLSYSNGVLVNDTTNKTIRLMDGETPGGFKFATQNYVQTNAITSANLATNLTTALLPYAKTVDLAPYALTVDVNSAISAIPIYSLPTAGTGPGGTKGGIRVDGTSITINPSTGVISGSNQYTLPIATTSALGGVKVDGTTILINSSTGVISGANQYVLPTATTSVKGGVTVPAVATSGLNNSSGAISLATASTTQLGGVKVDGSTITINGSGVISGAQLYTLPTATTSVLGGVTIPAVANSGLTNTSGAIRLATATTNQLGGVKVDGVTITINGSGVIAANITGAIVFQGGWSAATNTPTLNNTSSAYNTNGFEFVTTAAGTVNFGAGNVSFAVGDNVIYDGVKWVKIPIGSSAGTTNNIVTFDNSGTGGATGSTFNGSAILTVSYNTVGASPLAGSSSLTTVGTIGTGTWNADIISSTYGGTGVNNGGRTLTISGANRVLDQNVNSGAAPTFDGANISGTAASLIAGNATLAANATSAGKATNIAGGANLRVAYNTAADTTAFIAAPTVDSTYLKYTTAGSLSWGAVTLATAATNLAGGAANRIHYQTGADTSGFVVAPTVSGTYLQWNGTSFVFSTVSGASGGTVTSITASTTPVNGLSLSGGVITGSGTIGITGTLSLISPPAIGSTTPNTGAFTILTVNSASTSAVTLSPTGSGTVTIAPTTAGTINNMSVGASTAATGRFTTITATTQAATTSGGGTIYLNNTTNSRIDFAAGGANFGAPTFTNTSVGAKLVLYPAIAAASADYAIGIEGSTLWFGTPTTSEQFKWYAGTTNTMTLSGAGALSATSFTGATSGAHNGTVGAITPSTGVFTTLTSTDNRDTVYASGATTGTITPNAANGNVQTITLTGSITLNALTSPVSGQSITLIVKQPASGGPYTLTSSMLFAGGFKTLSTAANAIDMITVSYIGTSYYASLVTGFA